MHSILQTLLDIQPALLHLPPTAAERRELLEQLRHDVPPPVLAHFLRLVEQGRKGVGVVHHNVCSACHLRLPSGTEQLLAKSADLHLCDHCDCYLTLPMAGSASSMRPPLPEVRRIGRSRKMQTMAIV